MFSKRTIINAVVLLIGLLLFYFLPEIAILLTEISLWTILVWFIGWVIILVLMLTSAIDIIYSIREDLRKRRIKENKKPMEQP